MGTKTPTEFDDLAEEVANDADPVEPQVEVVGGNEVLSDPDTGKLNVDTMEMLIEYINRYAAIKDELNSLGAEKLIAEADDIHAKVKEIMYDGGPSLAHDETSNFEAVLSAPRSSDVWDLVKFRKALKPAQRSRYIVDAIASGAVKDGLANGDLSRAHLEKKGAVRKEYGSRALSIRERKTKGATK